MGHLLWASHRVQWLLQQEGGQGNPRIKETSTTECNGASCGTQTVVAVQDIQSEIKQSSHIIQVPQVYILLAVKHELLY